MRSPEAPPDAQPEAEAATEVNVMQTDATSRQLVHENQDLVECFGERRRVKQL